MRKFISASLYMIAASSLLACAPKQDVQAPQTAQALQTAQPEFMDNLRAHCGKAYTGKLVSTDAVDADMVGQAMVMNVNCTDKDIRIPFAIGDNRSRTWVFTKTDTGLRLKHQHKHKDGTLDKVSWYGGDTAKPGTATRQEFPVDDFSIALFKQNELDVSVTNVWVVEITPEVYAYGLTRKNRHFRVEFDLSKEVPTPSKPW